MDRCFVCGGNDTCLGCDGIPFSTVICAPQNLIPGQGSFKTNITFTGVFPTNLQIQNLISIPGSNPSPSLIPTSSSTGQSDPNGVLEVHFVSVREIRPDGSVVVEYLIDDLPFLLSSSVNVPFFITHVSTKHCY